MARPLTKTKQNGQPYVRPASIEVNINGALGQDLSTLNQRLLVSDHSSSQYLTTECLVHLMRESGRRGDDKMRDAMVLAILARCETNLNGAIHHSRPNAALLREEVAQEFAALLASDITGNNPTELDYFECKFNAAFRTFRIDRLRKERRKTVPLPDESGGSDDEAPIHIDDSLCQRASQGDRLARQEVLNALPPDIRDAVVLVHEMEFDIESNDPTKRTAATICGVTGRTIRNRLAQAGKYLTHLK
jgi:hypothetical protein